MLPLDEFLRRFSDEFREFHEIVDKVGGDSEASMKSLSACLSRLMDLGERCPDAFVDDELEPPSHDSTALREKLIENYPSFGFYYCATPNSEEILVGDAIDDLTDISIDLNDAMFYLTHGIRENCAWHIKLLFPHWGEHAIGLKRYLHHRIYEW